MSTTEDELVSGSDKRFLTDARIEQIGLLIEPMLSEDLSWIERRKETVEILDDTALRRQISVDFSLRGSTAPLLPPRTKSSDEELFCAPVFVLAKTPADLMAFDLEDEDGHGMTLISRADNARISGSFLVHMAGRILNKEGRDLPSRLAAEVRRIAEANEGAGLELARRLISPAVTKWPDEIARLRKHDRFVWWLETLAHSSIVVVLFRSAGQRR
jgi:hypothetical protein